MDSSGGLRVARSRSQESAVDRFVYSLKQSKSGFRAKSFLNVPLGRSSLSSISTGKISSITKRSTRSGGSKSSMGSSLGSGSALSEQQRRRRKRTGRKTEHRDTLVSRLRDLTASSDVFIENKSVPVHLTCIKVGTFSCLPFFIILVWDQLAVTTFEMPHISMINYPGFMLFLQFVQLLMFLYGYTIQYVSTGGDDKYTKIAVIGLIISTILFFWRTDMELRFDGFRYQEKLYLPRPVYQRVN